MARAREQLYLHDIYCLSLYDIISSGGTSFVERAHFNLQKRCILKAGAGKQLTR